jgi:hypothetical protein
MISRLVNWLGEGRTFGFALLVLWAVYFLVTAAGNLTDLLWSFGWINPAFRSGNLHWVTVTTSIYVHSTALDQVLLAGALLGEAFAGLLFCGAAIQWVKRAPTALNAARAGFLIGTTVFVAYAISVEATISYERGQNETDYWVIVGGLLLSLLVTSLRATTSPTDPNAGSTAGWAATAGI